MIYSTVEGLRFTRFRVFGEHIPSVRMIEGILNDRHTNEAKHQFCQISNECCEAFEIETLNELPPDIPENKLKRQRIEIDRNFLGVNHAMSEITGHDFYTLVRHQYVRSWYSAVAGNFSGGNPQAVRKGKRPLDVNSKGEIEQNELSIAYPDFREAEDYSRCFYVAVASLYKAKNVDIIILSNRQDDIFKERATLEEKIRKHGKKIAIFFCKYCQKYHEFDTFKARSHCDDCDKEYSKETSKTHRSNPSTIIPPRLTCFYCLNKRNVFVRSSNPTQRFCESCSFEHKEIDAIEFWSK